MISQHCCQRNTGAFNNKEDLLLLDRIEEWVGRCEVRKIGKEGAEIAAESGEKALQTILAQAAVDNDASSGDSDNDQSSVNSFQKKWTENVGDGRLDDDNLSFYLRFSEGNDREWSMKKGFKDLSKYGNRAILINPDKFHIEETTSNVDEGGDSEKVKKLYDLVYGDDESNALSVTIKRGSSLDTGYVSCST